ncbi:GL19507 [Drosophila persimilis]|uniref:GL19507 n=1 Tax=Drosophila persimilis TaxID=7234 RepID=B4G9M4_DROPE|nr:GL19507 [Drosophila persimilis]
MLLTPKTKLQEDDDDDQDAEADDDDDESIERMRLGIRLSTRGGWKGRSLGQQRN